MDLDKLLTLRECAEWLGLERHALSRRSSGKRAPIPAIRLSKRCVRFHPRTVLVKLAHDAGVPVEVIAASLNRTDHENQTQT
jgi:hypothetical protein